MSNGQSVNIISYHIGPVRYIKVYFYFQRLLTNVNVQDSYIKNVMLVNIMKHETMYKKFGDFLCIGFLTLKYHSNTFIRLFIDIINI